MNWIWMMSFFLLAATAEAGGVSDKMNALQQAAIERQKSQLEKVQTDAAEMKEKGRALEQQIQELKAKLSSLAAAHENLQLRTDASACYWTDVIPKIALDTSRACKANHFVTAINFVHKEHVEWWRDTYRIMCCQVKVTAVP